MTWCLRHEFDSERIPELSGPAFLQDIHSVSSLCKLYFRELPNPLLTYQLYGKFSVSRGAGETEEEGAGVRPAQPPSCPCALTGSHVRAWGGGTPGAGPRCHPAAAPTALQVNQEGQGRAWRAPKGVETQVFSLRSCPQDPGVPAEALGPHGETQCQHQHACP